MEGKTLGLNIWDFQEFHPSQFCMLMGVSSRVALVGTNWFRWYNLYTSSLHKISQFPPVHGTSTEIPNSCSFPFILDVINFPGYDRRVRVYTNIYIYMKTESFPLQWYQPLLLVGHWILGSLNTVRLFTERFWPFDHKLLFVVNRELYVKWAHSKQSSAEYRLVLSLGFSSFSLLS